MADRPPPAAGVVATGAANRRQLLLRALYDDPTNDDALAVYADALTAANDPRGELIMVERALAGPLSIRRRGELRGRRDELLAAYRTSWFQYRGLRTRTRAGVVIAISGPWSAIERHPAVFETEPVVELELRRADAAAITKLIAAPWLSRIRKLIIRGKIGDELFGAVIASPALANLTTLNVTGNQLTTSGLALLAGQLPRCRTLVLTNNRFDRGLAGLAQWVPLDQLATLYLARCGLTVPAIEQLLTAATLSQLTTLSLSDNDLGDAIATTIARHGDRLPAVRHLELQRTAITAHGVSELCRAPLPALAELDVRRNRIAAASVGGDSRVRS